jgi:hypothetical protein
LKSDNREFKIADQGIRNRITGNSFDRSAPKRAFTPYFWTRTRGAIHNRHAPAPSAIRFCALSSANDAVVDQSGRMRS